MRADAPGQGPPSPDRSDCGSTRRPDAARELRITGVDRLARGARVLEVGTGDGRLVFGYGQTARSVLAIDVDADAIGRARGRAARLGWSHVRFAAIAAQELDVGRERFDLALLAWSL